LLTPLATPACRTSALARTVAVSGATTADRPSPNTVTAGSTCHTYEAPSPIRPISTIPAAATSSPAAIGRLGPIRWASAPAREDSSSISTVSGSRAVPAATAEKPETTCRFSTNRKNITPIPPYTTNVTTFTAENSREEKTSSGSIGRGTSRAGRPRRRSGRGPISPRPLPRARSTRMNPTAAASPSTAARPVIAVFAVASGASVSA
jgi:hypothetical protein